MGPSLWLFIQYLPDFSDDARAAIVARYGTHSCHTTNYAVDVRNFIEAHEAADPWPPGTWPSFGAPLEHVARVGGVKLAMREGEANAEVTLSGQNAWQDREYLPSGQPSRLRRGT